MNRRTFVSNALTGAAALGRIASAKAPDQPPVTDVLVMFKCHLDVGFVDTQAAIVHKYFHEYYPKAIEIAAELRAKGKDHYVWTTGSWMLYEYLAQANQSDLSRMQRAIANGDIAWHALPFTWQSELLDPSAVLGAIGFSKALDKRFGRHTTGAKMTDVPGHTRGLIAPLNKAGVTFLDIGVNSASTPPDVPPLFIWRDPAGSSIVVMYHRTAYGGVVRVPGAPLAVAVEVRDDNSGPHTIDEISQIYAELRTQFPGSRVRAANLTEIANEVTKHTSALPVFTQEIGDTWIYGVASDPTKLRQYRELLRARSEWVKAQKFQPGDAVDLAFLSKYSLAVEHTWGTDTKTWLDFDHYTPSALQSMLGNPKYKTVLGSWQEKRNDIKESVRALPKALAADASQRLARLKPVEPETSGLRTLETGKDFETTFFRVRVDPTTGALTSVQNKRSGKYFADDKHPLALFSYQTMSEDDYKRFLASYITVQTDWAPKDFGKPNIGRYGARSKTWHSNSTKIWRPAENTLLVRLHLGEQVDNAVTAWPETVYLRYEFSTVSPTMNVTLQWFRKRPNRMPEALWLTFQPRVRDPKQWRMSKLEHSVSPDEVVSGGNRHMHAVTGPISNHDGPSAVSIESLDAAVVALGERSPIYFSNDQPDLEKGLHYSLYNNGWGTNYIQWFGDDALFRFQLHLG
jgi:hypothetical protein